MSRIRWTANQEKKLAQAVRSYNAAVTRMEKSGKYIAVPNRTSVQREHSLIETGEELDQRVRELGRILKKNNPKADEPVDVGSEGMEFIVPKYLNDEIKLAARTINERRKKIRLSLFTDAAEISKATEVARLSNKNLRDINEDNYVDGDDLDVLWEEAYPKTYQYAEQYKAAWLEYNGDESVIEYIDWFAENEPDKLHEIFSSGDDEVEINYIYSVEKSSDKTPVITRHNRIIKYWEELYDEYAR